MDKNELKELGIALAMYDYYKEIIENAKEKIRSMTDEEVKEINEGIFLTVDRAKDTKKTYKEGYKEAKKELTAKLEKEYLESKVEILNHKITLRATSYSQSKAEIITKDIATLNKTTIQELAKSASKKANIK